ncbi:MAG: aldo/keto reductase [Lachnospiraceae bacterium]|nr:aldo/keto reductase [Lachnospiraceae bacterium]
MKYRIFGKTGMRVSAMTLGTWGMGGVGWDVYDDAVKADAIRAAYEEGINFIDTAPAYNGGAAERFLGKTLKEMGIRKEMQISTKCGNIFTDGKVYVRDSRYDTIIRQCEESLVNLQTDYIDLMLIHWPDPSTPFEETMDALQRLKKEGKILHIGVSNFSIEQMKELGQYGEVEAFQPQYSMVYRNVEDIIRWAAGENMGIMTYGSLGGGILTGRYRTPVTYPETDSRNRFYKHFQEPHFSKVLRLLETMDEVSSRNNSLPLSQIALNWSYSQPFVSTCIVGAQKRERVVENARSFDYELPADDLALLNKAVDELGIIA